MARLKQVVLKDGKKLTSELRRVKRKLQELQQPDVVNKIKEHSALKGLKGADRFRVAALAGALRAIQRNEQQSVELFGKGGVGAARLIS